MDFSQVEAEFEKLKRQYQASTLTEAEFKAQLEKLMVQDEQGRWWMIGYETGQWYCHDGKTWVRADPPQVAARRRDQVEALCREGATALAAGHWGAATERFEAALALEPGHPDATARLAEAKAQAQQARESEERPVVATRPTDTLRRVPPQAYGRVAVLILLLLGFLGPWWNSGYTRTVTGWRIFIDTFTGRTSLTFVLTLLWVSVLFFVTLLRVVGRDAPGKSIVIWERIASGAALIGLGYIMWMWQSHASWGFLCALAVVLLASLNLIAQHVINRVRRQSGSTDSSADPGQRLDG